MMSKSGNGPREYRALLRKAKAANDLSNLVGDARRLVDPYYASLALFDLSANPKMGPRTAVLAADESLLIAGKVKSNWRRAELLSTIARKLKSWRGQSAPHHKEKLLDRVLESIMDMPRGKGLSDAITGCAPRIGCVRLRLLLDRAISNKGFEADDARAVIRQWAKGCKDNGPSLEEVMNAIEGVEDAAVKSRLLGYLHMQCCKSGQSPGSQGPLSAAVDAALTAGAPERLEALRYLANQSSTRDDLEAIARAMEKLDKPQIQVKLTATLGGSADRAGLKEMAINFFKEGFEISSRIEDTKERAKARRNMAKGLERCGREELAQEVQKMAIQDDESSKKINHTAKKSEVLEMPRAEHPKDSIGTLALYDTYVGGLGPVHVRAVARAAPLCVAFGLNLALLGFPAGDLEELVLAVTSDTNVGKNGKYLKELLKHGRIVLVPAARNQPPKDWSELGLPVATTSRPEEKKKVDMARALELAKSNHPLKKPCLIMGLGKRGLPPSLLDAAPYHLELTGSGIPLETCTAMGIIAQQLASCTLD